MQYTGLGNMSIGRDCHIILTRIVTIHPATPQPRALQQVAQVIERGGVVAYPTDTTYGIGCDIRNPKAIERIYRLKNKNKKDTLSFVCADLSHLADYAVVSNTGFRLMKRLLPGPYTFVLKATKLPPRVLQTRQKTVGIRVPDHAVPRALVDLLGHPIVSTTANISGEMAIADPHEIAERLGHDLDLVIDVGPIVGELSTVVEIADDGVTILREGKGVQAFSDDLR